MKKQLIVAVFVAIVSVAGLYAQGGGQRQTPEERTKTTMEKMLVLNLDADAKIKTQAVILDFNKTQQKAMEEMRASGKMDRDAMREKRKELADARDAKLKTIFTEEQLKKWKEEIEPSMRPQRGNAQPSN